MKWGHFCAAAALVLASALPLSGSVLGQQASPSPPPRTPAATAGDAAPAFAQAVDAAAALPVATPAADTRTRGADAWSWQRVSRFDQLGRRSDMMLSGLRNVATVEFQVRRDRLVRAAELDLSFTPSPALLPTLSHIRFYLNDGLMAVVPITREQLGKPSQATVPLDARLLGDFNQIRMEFVGHYTDICEEPVHSSLWVSISKTSTLHLAGEPLAIQDDLSNFPLPFLDTRDSARLELPVVFAGPPSIEQQRAAAVMASYFGSLAGWWRQARFPVSFDRPPAAGHALVLAVNGRLPGFLAGRAPVAGPTIEIAAFPGEPERKLLLVLGRNDADLQIAVAALAAGSPLLRGTRAVVDKLETLTPRKPYDAPNWVRTDRPVRLQQLLDYKEQLRASGVSPQPITLNLNLPPDLFVWRSEGIPLDLKYRYTPPSSGQESRLNVSLNDEFVTSFPLLARGVAGESRRLRLPVRAATPGSGNDAMDIPALRLGQRNQLRFDFNFASVVGSAQRDQCQTTLPPSLQAVIEGDSVIDFSDYHHYLAMPDLSAFALSGFPFTRMADLSDTVVLVPAQPNPAQVGTLLNTVGGLGMLSGYPGHGLRISDDWAKASRLDADLLVLGSLPEALRGSRDLPLIIDNQRSTLLNPLRPARRASALDDPRQARVAPDPAGTRVAISAQAPFAAIVGLQSPHHPQRSIVSLAASTPADFALLDDALSDIGKREAMWGSVAILRNSGVSSQFVGARYFVGELPWWTSLWYRFSDHPWVFVLLVGLAGVVLAFLLWQALRKVAARRLTPDA